jgi:hypothetical protein
MSVSTRKRPRLDVSEGTKFVASPVNFHHIVYIPVCIYPALYYQPVFVPPVIPVLMNPWTVYNPCGLGGVTGVVDETAYDLYAPGVVDETPYDSYAPGVVDETPYDSYAPGVVDSYALVDDAPGVVDKTPYDFYAPGVVDKTPYDFYAVDKTLRDQVFDDTPGNLFRG